MALTNIRSKAASETRNVTVDLSRKLDADELLTGTPTVAEVSTSDLTISSPEVIDANRTVVGRTILASQGVQFTVAGGIAGTTYTIRITATSDASPAQTLVETISFRVN